MNYTELINSILKILTIIGFFIFIYKKYNNIDTSVPKEKNTDKTTLLKSIAKIQLYQPEPKLFYVIPQHIEHQLNQNIKNKEYLEKLLYSMTDHLGIDGHFITLYIHDNTNAKYSGMFTASNNGKVSITLQIQQYYNLNTVAAILAHELTHMYLEYKGIKEPVPELNEILTDTAAVYLGFGEYMYKGYSYEKANNKFHKVGYLSPKDIKFIINEIYDIK